MAYILGAFDVLLFPHYNISQLMINNVHLSIDKHMWFSKILAIKLIMYYVHVHL